jgi:hypothetical protein
MSGKKFKIMPMILILGIIASLLFSVPVFAGLGKIAGKVTDETGAPLPGAQLLIAGTSMGAAANISGEYFILNVPPGVYTLKVTMMGYTTQEIENVRTSFDVTTPLDVQLKTTIIEGETVSIVAERPLVDKTMTATKLNYDEAIVDNALPVAELNEVIRTSVTAEQMRGANRAGVGYLIDGVNVSDVFYPTITRTDQKTAGYSYVKHTPTSVSSTPGARTSSKSGDRVGLVNTSSDVPMTMVQEVDVIAGTVNAEYASSGGVINLASRSGGKEYSGKLYIRSSAGGLDHAGPNVYENPVAGYLNGLSTQQIYLNNRAELRQLAAEDTSYAKRLSYFDWEPGKYGYGDDPRINADFRLGGPLTEKGNFLLSGNLLNDHGRFPGEFQRTIGVSAKVNYEFSADNKLTAMVKVDDGGKILGWKNRQYTYMYTFFLEGQPVNDKASTMSYLKWTKTLDPSSFITSMVSFVTNDQTYGFCPVGDQLQYDNYGDFLILDTVAKSQKYLINPATSIFSKAPGNDSGYNIDEFGSQMRIGKCGYLYEDYNTRTLTLKSDFVKQVNFHHQLKAGAEYQITTLDNIQHCSTVGYGVDSDFLFDALEYNVKPWSFGTYVQDRIEYEGIIVNAGLRFDGYNYNSITIGNMFGYENDELESGIGIIRPAQGDDSETHFYFSPRLGISHPITENAAMHYSWGIYTTPCSYSDVFGKYNTFTNTSLPNLFDPDPDPEKATAYEIGMNVAVTQDFSFDFTAYYRDTRNASRTSYNVYPDNVGFSYYTYSTSWGYRDSRGIELNLMKRRSGDRYFGIADISGRLSFSYSYNKGSSSAGSIAPLRFDNELTYKLAEDSNFDFDDRYTWPTYSRGYNDWNGKLTLLFDFPYRIQLSTLTTYNSGWYYKPVTKEINDRYEIREQTEPYWQTDIRLAKQFAYSGMNFGAFVQVLNLFDRLNILDFDDFDTDDQARYEIEGDPWGTLNRPVNEYGDPLAGIAREIYFGLEFSF